MPTLMQQAFLHAAGNAVAGRVARRMFRDRLRVLAYHEVADPSAFEAQVRHLLRYYAPVQGRAVAAALRGVGELPPNAVWITFDDGHASVVRHAQPILDRFGSLWRAGSK